MAKNSSAKPARLTLDDWRAETLARVRAIINEADPEIVLACSNSCFALLKNTGLKMVRAECGAAGEPRGLRAQPQGS